MTPFRIEVKSQCIAGIEQLQANAAANAGARQIEKDSCSGRKLAICGGGPLLANDLEALRTWDGDIWAINYTVEWLRDRGIDATLFTVDPQPFATTADSAIISTLCHPSVFESLGDRALAFNSIESHADGFPGGTASASRAPSISFFLGYRDVSFFGCEGSLGDATHVDRDESYPAQLIVRAGDGEYRTILPFLVQCEELSMLIRTFPDVYKNRSSGLLAAMIEHPDTWAVVAVSEELKRHLEAENGAQGLYDTPYPLKAA